MVRPLRDTGLGGEGGLTEDRMDPVEVPDGISTQESIMFQSVLCICTYHDLGELLI